jgi:hypothetical protein
MHIEFWWRSLFGTSIWNTEKEMEDNIKMDLGVAHSVRAERPEFNFQQELNFFLGHRFQAGPGAHAASYATGTGTITLVIKRSGYEADHSP